MRLPSLFMAFLLLSVLGTSAPGVGNEDPPAAQRAEVARRYGLDPASSLESRVRATPAAVLKMFEEDAAARPTSHALTKEERRKVSAAFALLPPFHQQVL